MPVPQVVTDSALLAAQTPLVPSFLELGFRGVVFLLIASLIAAILLKTRGMGALDETGARPGSLPGARWRWRRAAWFTLCAILAWSLLAQALGTLFLGRSWPEGMQGASVGTVAFLIVIASAAVLRRRGHAPEKASRHGLSTGP